MYVQHFGRKLCVILEPAERRDVDDDPELESGPEAESAEAPAPWFDSWSSADGRFLRVGRLTLILRSRKPAKARAR
jgi:hypothetical protein